MTVFNPHPAPVHSRRHVLSWAVTAAVAAETSRFAGVAAASNQATPEATTSGFLDANLVHDISVTFDQSVYDAMIETFSNSGDKEWIEAAILIDGSAYETVGMRLKGNSSLGGFVRKPAPGMPEGDEPAAQGEGDGPTTHVEGEDRELESAEHLPWLIRLDKFTENQNHQGITELVIRSNRSETSLNEAVALELLTLAGLASQRAAAARFSVNDSSPVLRLAIEHPNDAWMAAHFSADGLLYKAEAGGDFSYRGDDPESYKDVFDLEAGGTGDDVEDMQPLFDFLSFLNDSDDEAFASQLPDRLDVDAFATYQAMMDLIGNFDDISGPGNNAYLYVGPGSSRFTVVPWDMNLAFDSPRQRGEVAPVVVIDGTPQAPDENAGDESGDIEIFGIPITVPGIPDKEVRVTGPGAPNKLVERCDATPGFTDLVDETRSRLQDELYESGTAASVLDRWVDVLKDQASDMVGEDTITTESDAIAEYFTRQP